MYGYPQPPMWGYPQPPPQMDHSTLERGIQLAMKINQREAREKERHEHRKKRDKADEMRQKETARARTLTSLEWFIIGIVCYPVVGPLYLLAIHNLQGMVK